jgi:hypothetical protein
MRGLQNPIGARRFRLQRLTRRNAIFVQFGRRKKERDRVRPSVFRRPSSPSLRQNPLHQPLNRRHFASQFCANGGSANRTFESGSTRDTLRPWVRFRFLCYSNRLTSNRRFFVLSCFCNRSGKSHLRGALHDPQVIQAAPRTARRAGADGR